MLDWWRGGVGPIADWHWAGKTMSSVRTILVTGGGGFIGSTIVDLLLREGYEVGVLDDFSTGDQKNLAQASSATIHEGDVTDAEFVRRTVKGYDAVVHEAALVSVSRSVEDPLRSSRVNVDGTLNLLIASQEAKVKKFIFASSSSVYGDTATLPKTEDMNTLPISPYAVSKLAAENYCRVFARVHGLCTVCLRYFNVYGPRQKHGPYSGVIPAFVRSVTSDNPPVIFGDGAQTRDFTYVEDVAEANILCLRRPVEPGTVLNIGMGKQVSINELAATVERLLERPDLGVKHEPTRRGDTRMSYSDITKARATIGYSPRFTLEDGLRNVIEWFRRQGLPGPDD